MTPVTATADHASSVNTRHPASPVGQVVDSGFAGLNDILHQRGLPTAGLVELLCADSCPPALRLMLPAMAARQQQGLLVLANPPARPSAATLRHAAIKSHRLLVLRSEHTEALLQACHNSLASGRVSTLIVWLAQMDDQIALRRLHLAALKSHCLLVAMRPLSQAERPSPAILRLRLRMQPPEHLAVDVVKQPGGWGGQKVNLALLSMQPERPQVIQQSLPLAAQPLTSSRYSDPDSRFAWRRPVQAPAGLQQLPF